MESPGPSGLLAARYALDAGDAVVLRPDGHVAARVRQATRADIVGAVERLEGRRS